LQNAKQLKHRSSSMLPSTCTIAILANLKYARKKKQALWMLKECARAALKDSHQVA
jgi:hypothetical protein